MQQNFHMENFKRRSRYVLVFAVLTAAFLAITVLNINTGNVDISVPEILRIIFKGGGSQTEYNIIWEDPPSPDPHGGIAWRGAVPFRLSAADLF